jgi:tRNA-specific 2-thiouridylase
VADKPNVVALSLLSGGLDSMLAAKLLVDQGIKVIGVNFCGAYCPRPAAGKSNAEKAAETLGIELVTLPIDDDFVAMVKRPKHGWGKNMNPCIDCHTLMIRKAWKYGESRGALLIATGEVLGQRPMSQNREALAKVARDSGVGGRLLRPMSAKLLDETEPEKEGLVDRSRLLDFQGRQRTPQMELAARYRITEYPAPAGGCLLTEKVYSKRLADAFDHGEGTLAMMELLRFGRHFRLPSGARLIVGRDEPENDELLRRKPAGAVVIDAGDLPGPVGIVIGEGSGVQGSKGPGDGVLAARICARFSDKRKDRIARVVVAGEAIDVEPAGEEESARLLIA